MHENPTPRDTVDKTHWP